MRLIDADALFRKVKTECNPYGKPTIGFEDGKKVMNWIEHAPTISGMVWAMGYPEKMRFCTGCGKMVKWSD